ncbi:MAG: hypothetical protein OEY89_18145, partial [Gammaproteobacteria bacterium]|nr:hypothetical protein [Gammaproteobacteria bacterium]
AHIEDSTMRPAIATLSEFALGPGIHKISISSGIQLLVNPAIKVPVIPLPGIAGMSQEKIAVMLENLPAEQKSDFQIIEAPATKQMRAYLEQAELSNAGINEILPRAEALYQQNMSVPDLLSMLNRIRKSARWEPYENILQSAGIRQIETVNWQPESPAWREYGVLLLSEQTPNRMLRSGEKMGIAIFNTVDKKITFNVKVMAPWFVTRQPVTLQYQIDQGPMRQLRITDKQTISLRVPKGHHYLNVDMSAAEYNQFLWLQLTESNGEPLIERQRRKYFVATHNEPLDIIVNGPAWLRVDSLQEPDITTSEYQFVETGSHSIRFEPGPGQDEMLLRVFRRTSDGIPAAVAIPRHNKNLAVMFAPAVVAEKIPPATQLIDGLTLGEQEDGTLSYKASLVKRRSVEDVATSDTDSYLELDTTYRYFDEQDDRWYQLSAMARLRGASDDTLGMDAQVRGRSTWIPIDWTIKTRALAQQLENSTALAANIDLSLSQQRYTGLKSYHMPKLNLFARAHKLEFIESEFIDADIYTQYKNDHLNGLSVSDNFVYRSYLDQEYYAGIKATSNEGLNGIDQHGFALGCRQLLGDYRLDLKITNTRYHQDENRLQEYSSSSAELNLAWEQWRKNRHRLEMALHYEYDFYRSYANIRVDFSYHQSAGRDYRDFSPDEIVFRGLRETRLPQEPNNVIY